MALIPSTKIPGAVQLEPSDLGNQDATKRQYTRASNEGADPSEVQSTLAYRFSIAGDVMVGPGDMENRFQYDLLAEKATKLGLVPRYLFIPSGQAPELFTRGRSKTSPRRYTAEEHVIYLMHFPGLTDHDIARGMFPETPQVKLLLPRVRMMLRKLELEGRIRRERDPNSGVWRHYPVDQRTRSGTRLSRALAVTIAGPLGLKMDDVIVAVDDALRKIAPHRSLLGMPDHDLWPSILDPSLPVPSAEKPLVVEHPMTGWEPPEKPPTKRPSMTAAEAAAQGGDPF